MDDQELLRDRAASASTPAEPSSGTPRLDEPALVFGEQLRQRLIYIAKRRYRLRDDVAEDLVQASLVTFIEVADRYPNEAEHPMILVGIMRNKCRDHIRREVTRAKRVRVVRLDGPLLDAPLAAFGRSQEPVGVLDQMARKESGHQILDALATLRPSARQVFRLLEDGATRTDVIEQLGLNKNTADSRLHAYRKELKRLLADRGVHI